MNDAISRSELIDFVKNKYHDIVAGMYPYNIVAYDLVRIIENAPALDVEPVVRCKDCVHAAPLEGYARRKFEIGLNCRACRGDSGYGIAGLSFTVPDGYCDDGLRRAGEAE